jgi:hypothetical protein
MARSISSASSGVTLIFITLPNPFSVSHYIPCRAGRQPGSRPRLENIFQIPAALQLPPNAERRRQINYEDILDRRLCTTAE